MKFRINGVKNNLIRIKRLAIACLICNTLYAQQEANYILYRYTMNSINPAYAGADKNYSIATNIRNQWINVEGALKTQSFFYSQPLGDNIGLGLSIINDEVFIENQTSFNIDFSYRIQVFETANLFLGLKAGGGTYTLETDRLRSSSLILDPVLNNFNASFKPNIGMGFYLKHKDYFLSLSVPELLSNKRVVESQGLITQATEEAHLYLSGGYNFRINKTTEFRPSFMTRYVNAIPISIDITGAFRFLERFEIAAMYRTDQAISGMIMINFADWFDFGYAYDHTIRNEISNRVEGTHEIFLKFNFKKEDSR